MHVEDFRLPKHGHTDDEYEDAAAWTRFEAFPFRAAVADGATESAYSGGWARTLVDQYLEHGDLVLAAAEGRTLFTPPPDARWYVEAKAAQGAHAALLGLELTDAAWHAESIGDCCLFHLRGNDVLRSWPFEHVDAFHHRPHLISSLQRGDEPERSEGTWRRGDTFVLATDALAAWLLSGALAVFLEAADRPALAERGRRGLEDDLPRLRNDDLTGLVIHP